VPRVGSVAINITLYGPNGNIFVNYLATNSWLDEPRVR